MASDTVLSKSIKIILASGIALLAIIGIGTILYWVLNFSTRTSEQGVSVQDQHASQPETIPVLHWSLPTDIYGSTYRFAEITMSDGGEGARSNGIGSFSSGYSNPPTINIAFLDAQEKDFRLVFTSPVIISKIDYPRNKDQHLQKKILMKVSTHDSNQDGFVNSDDNSVLFAVDLDGTKLEQITPDSLTVLDYQFEHGFGGVAISLAHPNNDRRASKKSFPNKLYWYDFQTQLLFSHQQMDGLLEQAKSALVKK